MEDYAKYGWCSERIQSTAHEEANEFFRELMEEVEHQLQTAKKQMDFVPML